MVLAEPNLDHGHQALSSLLAADYSRLVPGAAPVKSIDNVSLFELSTPLIWFSLAAERSNLFAINCFSHWGHRDIVLKFECYREQTSTLCIFIQRINSSHGPHLHFELLIMLQRVNPHVNLQIFAPFQLFLAEFCQLQILRCSFPSISTELILEDVLVKLLLRVKYNPHQVRHIDDALVASGAVHF